MSFETISIPEEKKDIPEVTMEELIKYSGKTKEDDEEFRKWLEEKGIEFNDGIAEIKLDGEVIKTKEDDFGTIIQEPDALVK